MVLQKAMKQGRNIHGIPLLDACSDRNITTRMCGHVGGHAYSVSPFSSSNSPIVFNYGQTCIK